MVAAGSTVAIAPQVLAEFIHIVTDPRRFAYRVEMTTAAVYAEQWRTQKQSSTVLSDEAATRQFAAWIQFAVGTAADCWTLHGAAHTGQAGIHSVPTTTRGDFSVVGYYDSQFGDCVADDGNIVLYSAARRSQAGRPERRLTGQTFSR